MLTILIFSVLPLSTPFKPVFLSAPFKPVSQSTTFKSVSPTSSFFAAPHSTLGSPTLNGDKSEAIIFDTRQKLQTYSSPPGINITGTIVPPGSIHKVRTIENRENFEHHPLVRFLYFRSTLLRYLHFQPPQWTSGRCRPLCAKIRRLATSSVNSNRKWRAGMQTLLTIH